VFYAQRASDVENRQHNEEMIPIAAALDWGFVVRGRRALRYPYRSG
jgi:hypothetical protein